VLAEIVDGSLQASGGIAEKADTAIAWRTQQAPNQPRRVVMVNLKTTTPVLRVLRATDSTPSILRCKPSIVLGWSDPVLTQSHDAPTFGNYGPMFGLIALLRPFSALGVGCVAFTTLLTNSVAVLRPPAILVFLHLLAGDLLLLLCLAGPTVRVKPIGMAAVLREVRGGQG
jgi:hypothetical protein